MRFLSFAVLSLLLASACAENSPGIQTKLELTALLPQEAATGAAVVVSGRLGSQPGEIYVNEIAADSLGWSTTAATFVVPDLPPGEAWVKVRVGERWSNALSLTVVRGNKPPLLTSASLGNGPFHADRDITAELGEASDADGDPISLRFAWSINGVPYPEATTATLNRDAFKRGDEIVCAVTPHDGQVGGKTVLTESVTIANAPPQVPSIAFSLDSPGAGDPIAVTLHLFDTDGDPLTVSYRWYVNGEAVADATGATLSSGPFVRGDSVTIAVSVSDGTADVFLISAPIVIGNSAPAVHELAFSVPSPSKDTGVAAVLDADDIDGDSLTVTYAWTVNGTIVEGQTGAVLDASAYKKGDALIVTVTVEDALGGVTERTLGPVTVGNSLPALAAAAVGGGPYATDAAITVTPGTATDADNDAITFTYRWFVDGVTVPGETSNTLSGAHFAKGQTVRAEVTPHDDEGAGSPVLSNEITVQNTVPVLAAVDIGDEPHRRNDTIEVVSLDVSDLDNDTVSFAYQWYVDGWPEPGATNASLAGVFERGFEVYVQVTPNDGEADGLTANSNTVTIANTAPKFAGVNLSSGPYYSNSVITALPAGWEDDDGDAENYRFAWYVDGNLVGSVAGGTIDGNDFAWGVTVAVLVTADDGVELGASHWSETVTILNTPPALGGASIAAGPYYTDDTITVTAASVSDAENDATTLEYRWFVGGLLVDGQTGASLSGAFFAAGQTVAAEVTPRDMHSSGVTVWSNMVTVSNTPPSLASVELGSGPYSKSDTLVASLGGTSDIDAEQTVTARYRWLVDSVEVPGEYGSSLTGAHFSKGQSVRVEARAWDGMDEGAPVLSSPVSIVNSPPSTPVVAIAPQNLKNSPGIWAEIHVSDADGDPITHTYSWYKDGVLQAYPPGTAFIPAADYAFAERWRVEITTTDGFAIAATAFAVRDIIFDVAVQVGIGAEHGCLLTNEGVVKCWGLNGMNQLALAPTDPLGIFTPRKIAGLPSDIMSIAVGELHTCALANSGDVYCWGQAAAVGSGTGEYNPDNPVQVPGLGVGVKAVTAGSWFSCALTAAGGVKCWGFNNGGQLGNGGTTNSITPTDALGLESGVKAIYGSYNHSCAMKLSGEVFCWGYNRNGQVGNGHYDNGSFFSYEPIAEKVLQLNATVVAVATGQLHTCALTDAKDILCWGNNSVGELGRNFSSLFYELFPGAVSGPSGDYVAISAGKRHTCALTESGAVRCWGDNSAGQLGLGTVGGHEELPATVIGLGNEIALLSAGYDSTCVVMQNGRVSCWGENFHGQLGTGDSGAYAVRAKPVVDLLPGTASVATGREHSCAVETGGTVRCWGHNQFGELGHSYPGQTLRYPPGVVNGLPGNVTSVALGEGYSCALTGGGDVYCWGQNTSGQLGTGAAGSPVLTPTLVTGLPPGGATAIAAGTDFACALTNAGGVMCWGNNDVGQIGNGASGTIVPTPANVSGLTSGVVGLRTGSSAACAILNTGGITCWGRSTRGGFTILKTPQSITGFSTAVTDVAVGGSYACAALSDGSAVCWGENRNGQTGRGTSSGTTATPTPVVGLPGAVAEIRAGQNGHTCALTVDGEVFCWGSNFYAQVGNGVMGGFFAGVLIPTPVAGLSSEVSSISAGSRHNCALTELGEVRCWGDNTRYQVTGEAQRETLPVSVAGF